MSQDSDKKTQEPAQETHEVQLDEELEFAKKRLAELNAKILAQEAQLSENANVMQQKKRQRTEQEVLKTEDAPPVQEKTVVVYSGMLGKLGNLKKQDSVAAAPLRQLSEIDPNDYVKDYAKSAQLDSILEETDHQLMVVGRVMFVYCKDLHLEPNTKKRIQYFYGFGIIDQFANTVKVSFESANANLLPNYMKSLNRVIGFYPCRKVKVAARMESHQFSISCISFILNDASGNLNVLSNDDDLERSFQTVRSLLVLTMEVWQSVPHNIAPATPVRIVGSNKSESYVDYDVHLPFVQHPVVMRCWDSCNVDMHNVAPGDYMVFNLDTNNTAHAFCCTKSLSCIYPLAQYSEEILALFKFPQIAPVKAQHRAPTGESTPTATYVCHFTQL